MPKTVTYEILKSCPKNTLFFVTESSDILLIKVSNHDSNFFSYTPFFNSNNEIFSENFLSEEYKIKFNKFMAAKNYVILEKKDINELKELFNHLYENFGKHNMYTLH